MKNRLAADRYAGALSAALADNAALEPALKALADFSKTLTENRELAPTLENPAIDIGAREAVLTEVLRSAEVPEAVQQVLMLLLQRGRMAMLPEVVEAFSTRVDTRLDRATAHVTTARPLTPEHEALVRESLAQYTGKTIHLVATVDPDIIGGVRARIGDKVIDGTLRARLRHLRDELIAEEIA